MDPTVLQPETEKIVPAVEVMVQQRGGTRYEPGGGTGCEVLWSHLVKNFCLPGSPVWFIPHSQTILVITEVRRMSIQVVRELWVAMKAGTRQCSTELVSLYPLQSNSLPRCPGEPSVCVISWFAVLLCPLQHHMVPRHERLASARECPWPVAQLPRLQRTDAVAQYLGLKCGDVIRIHRNENDPERHHIYYRVIV